MMTVNLLHEKYHKSTGIVFSSMYPGCIATTNLFREKRTWFRVLFPLFMKYVTGGYVSEEVGNNIRPQTETKGVKHESFSGSWRTTSSGGFRPGVQQVWRLLVLEWRCKAVACQGFQNRQSYWHWWLGRQHIREYSIRPGDSPSQYLQHENYILSFCKVADKVKADKMWEYSTKITGAKWP